MGTKTSTSSENKVPCAYLAKFEHFRRPTLVESTTKSYRVCYVSSKLNGENNPEQMI